MADESLSVVPTGEAVSAAPAVKITVRPNGPFRVEGLISLVDVNGVEWDLTGKPGNLTVPLRAFIEAALLRRDARP